MRYSFKVGLTLTIDLEGQVIFFRRSSLLLCFILRKCKVLMCLCMYICVCVCVCTRKLKKCRSAWNLIPVFVVYENRFYDFNIGLCLIKVKLTQDFDFLLHLPQYTSPIQYTILMKMIVLELSYKDVLMLIV